MVKQGIVKAVLKVRECLQQHGTKGKTFNEITKRSLAELREMKTQMETTQ